MGWPPGSGVTGLTYLGPSSEWVARLDVSLRRPAMVYESGVIIIIIIIDIELGI